MSEIKYPRVINNGCGEGSQKIITASEHDSVSAATLAIMMDDETWDDEYQPGELMDIDQLPPHDPRCVWTQIDGGDQGPYIVNGYQFGDREGYYITAKPAPIGQIIRVELDYEATADG